MSCATLKDCHYDYDYDFDYDYVVVLSNRVYVYKCRCVSSGSFRSTPASSQLANILSPAADVTLAPLVFTLQLPVGIYTCTGNKHTHAHTRTNSTLPVCASVSAHVVTSPGPNNGMFQLADLETTKLRSALSFSIRASESHCVVCVYI